jgi:hypothetical protein
MEVEMAIAAFHIFQIEGDCVLRGGSVKTIKDGKGKGSAA